MPPGFSFHVYNDHNLEIVPLNKKFTTYSLYWIYAILLA